MKQKDVSMESIVKPFNISLEPFERKRKSSLGTRVTNTEESQRPCIIPS